MIERPILFSGAMVRAILEGRKTVTRRVVKPCRHPFGRMLTAEEVAAEFNGGTCAVLCPYGQPGERLWVRETFNRSNPGGAEGVYYYRADGQFPAAMGGNRFYGDEAWKPSIHMPRAASRILLEITAVRVERLQAISEEQAKAEGAPMELAELERTVLGAVATYRAGFARLWQSINGAESWFANPWVWVVEFKRVAP